MTKIGILTGGGDCPGLNAVIRAVVKTAENEYGWEVLGIEDGYDGLFDASKVRRLTALDVRGILPRGGTILGTANRGNPFARKIERDGQTVIYDASQEALGRIEELDLAALIVVGGDGTLRSAYELYQLGAPIVGVPKTIDNDIAATDVTFGFDTALVAASEAVDKLHTTAESHHRVMVVEVMGRTAGWIALHAGISGGADVVVIPEISFDIRKICAKIEHRCAHGLKFSIIVVAEGASPIGGEPVYISRGDVIHQARLGGMAAQIAEQITQSCGLETRVTVLGHVQRGGSPTPFDRIIGSRFGEAAVHAAASGALGRMMALHGTKIEHVTLAEAVGEIKLVPPDGQLVRTARSLGISLG
ncbi:MAG: 6-phosphofructokinase [Chloroflexota bacterium]|nr:MAG: 6-phosphofructokinase [Chloroflexota bacterium]